MLIIEYYLEPLFYLSSKEFNIETTIKHLKNKEFNSNVVKGKIYKYMHEYIYKIFETDQVDGMAVFFDTCIRNKCLCFQYTSIILKEVKKYLIVVL